MDEERDEHGDDGDVEPDEPVDEPACQRRLLHRLQRTHQGESLGTGFL